MKAERDKPVTIPEHGKCWSKSKSSVPRSKKGNSLDLKAKGEKDIGDKVTFELSLKSWLHTNQALERGRDTVGKENVETQNTVFQEVMAHEEILWKLELMS